jgi:hypothetical protein
MCLLIKIKRIKLCLLYEYYEIFFFETNIFKNLRKI